MAKADIRPAEKTSRRSFLQAATGALIGLIGLVLGIPFLAALIGSAARTKEREFNDVAALDALPIGQPVDLAFSESFADGFIQGETVRRVWLVRKSASEVLAFSPI